MLPALLCNYCISTGIEDGNSCSLLHAHRRYLCIILSWDKSFALQVQSTQVPWTTLQCGSFIYATFSWKKLQSFPHLSPDNTFYRETIHSMTKFRCNDFFFAVNLKSGLLFHQFYQQAQEELQDRVLNTRLTITPRQIPARMLSVCGKELYCYDCWTWLSCFMQGQIKG